ncbi:MAG: sodium/proton-translocating pyrophosphatase, partial [Pirellulales bacterium]
QDRWVPFAFMTGGLFSGLAGWFGMKTATLASNRTAAAAQKSLNQGLQIAFRSGAVMGLVTVGLALIHTTIWFAILYWGVPAMGMATMDLEHITVTMLCFGMGASCQALFARVGGGIFTKAADVGADLVGKVEQSIPEDDPRNPATIADNVGDNVGDVAGMGADLFESYAGSILASMTLGAAAFISQPEAQLNAVFLPMLIAALGIILSIGGIFLVSTDENATQKTLLAALAKGINVSTVLVGILSLAICYFLLPQTPMLGFSVVVGLAAGWAIGKWTEYSTSDEFSPTKNLADQAQTGPATIIIGGIADGMYSVWVPILVISAATLLSFGAANQFDFTDPAAFGLGLYGVGIAAVGMLSTLGITLATDAYGPIADNAGGNAEMSGLDPVVRQRTDALDSLGNTTAATGKGFAIGSAALTALALLAAYVEEVRHGFDRWGDSAVSQEAEPGLYKVSPQLLVEVLGPGEDGAPQKSRKWLVYPTDAMKNLWTGINVTDGTTPVSASLLEATGEEVFFVGSKNRLLNLQDATLPAFMQYFNVTVMNPKTLVGILIGAMATFVFCALTMQAVGRAAKEMVEEVRRQFRELPGIMAGTDKPDYERPVAISTRSAQREMIVPSLLALLLPVLTGLTLGVGGTMGLLVGALSAGVCLAIFMANAGGSWDNAKKFIEAGAHGGKGTDAHKAAVVGDTVGDPFKDTSGPSLNILIKLMSMVAVIVAGIVVRYSLEAYGIF